MTQAISQVAAVRGVFWLCQVFSFVLAANFARAEIKNFNASQLIWADPRTLEPLPGRATPEQLRHLPHFFLSADTCMPAPVFDAALRLSKGLRHTRTINGDCLPQGQANIYVQSLVIGEYTALAYALYFPKDGAAPYGVGGHRHDWEYVIVWSKDARVSAVTFHQHEGWYTQPRDRVRLVDERPMIYVGRAKHGMYHRQHSGPGSIWAGICYFCDDRTQEVQPWYAPDALIDVDQLPAEALAYLRLKLWGKANSPFRPDVFAADAAAIGSGELCRGLGCRCQKPAEQCPAFP